MTAAGSPDLYSEVLRESGVTVLHVINSARQAPFAQSSGAEAVIAEECEAAGRLGFEEVPLFSLVPQVADAVSMPVIAAGDIADARRLVAPVALGAEGVQLGTRFVAREESIAYFHYKKAILAAGDTDTIVTCRGLLPRRSLKTQFTQPLVELDRSGASPKEISTFLGYRRARAAQIEGDLTEGETDAGPSAGLIKKSFPRQKLSRGWSMNMRKLLTDLCDALRPQRT